MMRLGFVGALGAMAALVVGCSGPKQEPTASASSSSKTKATSNHEATGEPGDGVAYFAGGCFWGVEHFLEKIEGVTDVESGYMGGHVDSPSYEEVSTSKSGHLETVRVRFHTDQVSYEAIARRFFEIHDPTQANGQGPDIGSQYLSAVFYASPEQKDTAASLIAQLEARGYHVATKLEPAKPFFSAESYHQDYYERTGKLPYCHTPVRRFDKDAD